MNSTSPLRHIGLLIFLSFLGLGSSAHGESSQPNIIFLMADDLGWADLGCFGSKYYQTPHLDRLAKEGMRFTSAYSNGPNCAPTRACLMSGLYSPRHGVYTVNTGARGKEKDRKLIPVENKQVLDPKFFTLAEALHKAGYDTAHFGKWHLGQAPKAGPDQQGFNLNVAGNKAGHPRSYFSPYRNSNLKDGPKGEYLTDRLTDEALKFLSKKREQPFFLYFPFYTVHTPIQGKKEIIKKYKDKPAINGQGNATYAAMIESMDENVGRLLKKVNELGIQDNTLIIFTSDNGGLGGYDGLGTRNVTSNRPLRGGKGMLYEGGIRVSTILRWPGKILAGTTCDVPIISLDFYPTLITAAGHPKINKQLDGKDLSPLFKNPKNPTQGKGADLFWHFPGYLQANTKKGTWRTTPAGAVRSGVYKLIEFFEHGRLELYDLSSDIGETQNLIKKKPDLARKLHQRLKAWRQSVEAPMPKPKP